MSKIKQRKWTPRTKRTQLTPLQGQAYRGMIADIMWTHDRIKPDAKMKDDIRVARIVNKVIKNNTPWDRLANFESIEEWGKSES